VAFCFIDSGKICKKSDIFEVAANVAAIIAGMLASASLFFSKN